MIKLMDKDFKTHINMLKNWKENMNTTEIEYKRMSNMEFQNIKNTESEIKISLERTNTN